MISLIFQNLFLLSTMMQPVLTGNYSDTLNFINERLSSARYNTQIRPVIDQSHVVRVGVVFELVSIVEVNDVTQSFTCNGLLMFNWTDELLVWNETMTGVTEMIHPLPENIWRPRVIFMNTLQDRDLFDDDKAPVFINKRGSIVWVPGSLFPASCSLVLTYFPFDEQKCFIILSAMTYDETELKFSALSSKAKTNHFTVNGEWDLISTDVSIISIDGGQVNLSAIQITFVMNRRPTFFMLNVLLPVVFLSFLNIFVFVIPAESGEKISYGITVLLSLSVYMSTVSGMLPRSSQTLPNVIIYLFILLILSMITVISGIIIVVVHNLEEQQDIHLSSQDNVSTARTKVTELRQNVSVMSESDSTLNKRLVYSKENPPTSTQGNTLNTSTPRSNILSNESAVLPRHVNRYKVIGRHINLVLFLVFLCIYMAVTLGFILKTALK